MATNIDKNIDLSVIDPDEIETTQGTASEDVFLGIDIGGTNTKIGLVRSNGDIVVMSVFPTQAHLSFAEFAENLTTQVNDELLSNSPGLDMKGIGVGAPNANYWNGRIEMASNLSWGTIDVVSAL